MAILQRTLSSSTPSPARAPRAPTLHDELVARAAKWLRSNCGCSVVLTELTAFTATGETPDAIGWRSNYSVLVECKATRGDFLADRRKPFRGSAESGMGSYRFYLCPPGLIAPDEVPEGWGLLYAQERTIQRVVGPKGNSWTYGENTNYFNRRHEGSEIAMLVSALRRVQENA